MTAAKGNGHCQIIMDSVADGVFTVDREWRITSFNRAAEQITGVPRDEAIGRRCCDVFRASICETQCALRHTIQTGKRIVDQRIYFINAEGNRSPISISTALLKDEDGRVVGGVETFRDLALVEELRKEIDGRHVFADIISKSHRMQRLFDILPEIAESESTVLIEGESGAGKELLARAIHSLSPRADGPFVAVNCGALPDTLLESELFGHKAGAFTDATRNREGRFARAQKGTILLDEIGDVSPALQVRLLRVLQERTYEPLGSSEPVAADVRVIAATHQSIDDLRDQGRFRSDLYYRINVIRLVLPPLRERKEDIPLLVDHFIARFNQLRGKNIRGMSPEALAMVMRHDYPGNVRELENIVEHCFVLCRGGMIEPRHMPDSLLPEGAPRQGPPVGGTSLKESEARFILAALEANHYNRLATARELGIHKSTLFRKIRAMRIKLPDQDGRSAPRPQRAQAGA